jgi:drug/metabolite transporter (DMT)-like permease
LRQFWDSTIAGSADLGSITRLAALDHAWLHPVLPSLARVGATSTSLVMMLGPGSAILLGTLVLAETLAPKHFAGMALIGLGLLAFNGRVWRWVK